MSYEFIVVEDTLPEAYHKSLEYLRCGEIVDCPEYNTRCIEVSMTMVVKHPTQEPRITKCGIFGEADLQQYCMEMLHGIMDFEVDKGNWSYTYHDRMVKYNGITGMNQILFVISELRKNPNSRRAVIDVRNNIDDMGADDPACLQHIQFTIRNGALNMYVLFRSNDAMKAAFMNAFALIRLQEWIATALGVPVGQYTHRANSYHAYERDWGMLDSLVIRNYAGDDLTYNYSGDWKERMEASVPEILYKVSKLKNK